MRCSNLHVLATLFHFLRSGALPSVRVTELHRYYGPIRHLPAPTTSLAGQWLFSVLAHPEHVGRLPLLRCRSVDCVSSPLPRWNLRTRFALRPQTAAFPVIMAGRLPQRHFEACSVFTHVTTHNLADPAERDLLPEGISVHSSPPEPPSVLLAGAMSPAGTFTR